MEKPTLDQLKAAVMYSIRNMDDYTPTSNLLDTLTEAAYAAGYDARLNEELTRQWTPAPRLPPTEQQLDNREIERDKKENW